MKKQLLLFAALFQVHSCFSQDTFSILAFDSITGEVGAAGASCVDLFQVPGYSNDFLAEIFPGEGAIATQANYLPANQANAKTRFLSGDSPTQIISWLQANDVQPSTNAQTRQYGIVRMNTGYPRSAAFTGTNCMNYKNHITGPNYSIHGNILLGQLVLDSMEARFNREKGDLACKLMAALQGANMVGADSRCSANGSSSLFAFLKVSTSTDPFGQPSFLVSVRTQANAGIEPIDSLQIVFDTLKSCKTEPPVTVGLIRNLNQDQYGVKVFPNPANDVLVIKVNSGTLESNCIVRDVFGNEVMKTGFRSQAYLNTSDWKRGIYFVEVKLKNQIFNRKIILN